MGVFESYSGKIKQVFIKKDVVIFEDAVSKYSVRGHIDKLLLSDLFWS